MVNEKFLVSMKTTAYLINNSRGQVVNQQALGLALKNNIISANTLKTADFIIKAIEMSSEALNKKANYSISIQNGYLNLMGIKLLTVPNLKNYF